MVAHVPRKTHAVRAGAAVASVAVGAAVVIATLPSLGGAASAATTTPAPTTTAPTPTPTPTTSAPTTPVVPVAISAMTDSVIGSAVAPNGDTHPYSVAVVPPAYTGAPLAAGDVLVGDLSNAAGVKGQGKSIVRFHLGTPSLFSTAVQGPVAQAFNAGGTALWVAGFGSADNGSAGAVTVLQTVTGTTTVTPTPTTPTPTTTSPTPTTTSPSPTTTSPTPTPTSTTVATVAGDPYTGGSIADTKGPWGLEFNHSTTAPVYFWANADGTIVRDSALADPFGTSSSTVNVQTTLATVSHGTSPSIAGGTVVAPSGLAYDPATDTLFVADSDSDQIVALKGAATSTTAITPTVVVKGGPLHTPRGLAIDPNTGDLLVTNGAVDNNLVDVTKAGAVVSTRSLDPKGAVGAIAGIATTKDAAGQTEVYYLDDNSNTLHSLSATADLVTINGATTLQAPYGSSVAITGRAPAGSTVAIYFHRANVPGYVQRRTLQADANGVFVTSFAPNDDYRYYAQVGSKVSPGILEQVTPSVVGSLSRVAKKNATIVLVGHGAPGGSVLLHFHKAGTSAANYSLLRSVHVDGNGVWTKAVKVSVDYRVYASRGTLHPYTPRVLLKGV